MDSPGKRAAQQFHRLAMAELGSGATKTALARLVGEKHVGNYGQAVGDHPRPVTLDRVVGWIRLWGDAGHRPMRLVITRDDVVLEFVS